MYFFDKEDFNCNEIPNDWEDYATTFRSLMDVYTKSFASWYASNQNPNISSECHDKIAELFDSWKNTFIVGTRTKFALFIAELVATPTDDTCGFDSTTYYNYLDAYNKMIKVSDEITLLTNSGCKLENFNRNVGVDISTITGDKKVSQCHGVYIKQIDNGSEFIGKIITPTTTAADEWSTQINNA